jgi:gluconolactonase
MTWADPLPAAAQRTATLVQEGFGFIEGPLWLAEQSALWFSDIDMSSGGDPNGPKSKIWRLHPPDPAAVVVMASGSNGLALALDGKVLAATHDVQSLSKFDALTGAREMLGITYQGKHFNSPNDLAVRSDGNVYFSDPDWQLGPRTSQIGMMGVYRVAPDGALSLVKGPLNKPNGVALSPDERTLYVGSQDNDVLSFALDAAGTPDAGTTFVSTGSSDGMGIDCAGNLYVVAGTIKVFSSGRQSLGEISVPKQPSNVAFGGPARKTLYITAQSGLYSIELNVPGRAY